MNNFVIYRITNSATGKCYVGYTNDLVKRTRAHFRGKGSVLVYQAVQKHGRKFFKVEIVESDLTHKEAKEREKHWILHFNCITPQGYNITVGGDGGPILYGEANPMKRPDIKKKHQESISNPEVKERHKKGLIEAFARPEVKERHRKAIDSPEFKEKHKKAINTPEAKEKHKKGMQGKLSHNSRDHRIKKESHLQIKLF